VFTLLVMQELGHSGRCDAAGWLQAEERGHGSLEEVFAAAPTARQGRLMRAASRRGDGAPLHCKYPLRVGDGGEGAVFESKKICIGAPLMWAPYYHPNLAGGGRMTTPCQLPLTTHDSLYNSHVPSTPCL
jgi:hypothetical protein